MIIETAKICGDGLTINGGGKWLAFTNPTVVDWFEAGNTPDPEFTEVELITTAENNARSIRDTALAKCDWTQSRDVNLTDDAEWQAYRQALRDGTSGEEWVFNPIDAINSIILTKPGE